VDQFHLTDEAIFDIDAIFLYLVHKANEEIADRVVTELFKAFPQAGGNSKHWAPPRRSDEQGRALLQSVLLPHHLFASEQASADSRRTARQAECSAHSKTALMTDLVVI